MTVLRLLNRYPTGRTQVPCDRCDGTGQRRNLLHAVVDCDYCTDGTVVATRPRRSISPDATGWDGIDRREPDSRKIVVTLPDGSQLYVGRWADDDSPDVAIREHDGAMWVPAEMAGLDVEDRQR